MKEVEITLGLGIVSSYKRLSYTPWYALAEFVDNATQAYQNNKIELDKKFSKTGERLEVKIIYEKGKDMVNDILIIYDNSIGMDQNDLENAISIGKPPKINTGRSRYGLGMKTASFWFGDTLEIETTKLGVATLYTTKLVSNTIAKGNKNVQIKDDPDKEENHFTKITISNLHRRFKGNTIRKIKTFLASIYRFDINSNKLILKYNNEPLLYEYYDLSSFKLDKEQNPIKRNLNFVVDGKEIKGWAGILKSGGRNKGGFSLIQSDRVIQTPPNGYKPESIFGEQEGGTNDLVNQRVVGELFLDGFEVSHTKDKIIWEGDQEDDLDESLKSLIGDFKRIVRDSAKKEVKTTGSDFDTAYIEFLTELKSSELVDKINETIIIPESVIEDSFESAKNVALKSGIPKKISIGIMTIHLYLDDKMSFSDPYVISESTASNDILIVIVNKIHPFWRELDGHQGILNYLRHCIYDAIAEYQAFKKYTSTKPNTIKHLKDDLLRIPYEIKE